MDHRLRLCYHRRHLLLWAVSACLREQEKAVVAVGCMAERYGNELSEALPEADAILGGAPGCGT